jgi:poly(A) polymerase
VGCFFPSRVVVLAGEHGSAARDFIRHGLANTDRRVVENKPITPTFLYAVLLWPAIKRLAEQLLPQTGGDELAAMSEACYRIIAEQIARTALPKRFSMPMREMLVMQSRFGNRQGARAARMLEHKLFRVAYDFLLLRARCGEVEQELADWWTDIQARDPGAQQEAFGVQQRGRKRRRGRRGGRGHARDAVT